MSTASPPKRLVIVGGGAGGASAAARARRICEPCEIIVFERGPHASFANCGLPYFVGGEIVAPEDLLVQTPESLRARFNLDVRVNTEVTGIDRTARLVKVRDRISGRGYEQPYDALILSTGATPLLPPIPGIEREGHFTVRNIPDVERIKAWTKDCRACRAVVVGGGYTSLEMAEQLVRHGGLSVSVVEAFPQVMAPLDPEMAAWLHLALRKHGVELFLGNPVEAFEAPGEGESARASVVVLKGGQRLPADSVVLALGVRPEASLAKKAGLEIGARGGIRVNEHLQTSDPNVWAVGDAVEVRDANTGAWSLVALAGPANRQGRIAADNVFGRPAKLEAEMARAQAGDIAAAPVSRVAFHLAGEFGGKRFPAKLEAIIKDRPFDVANLKREVPTLKGALEKAPSHRNFEVPSADQQDLADVSERGAWIGPRKPARADQRSPRLAPAMSHRR